ncbi:hypothetical protein SARC_04818 [Sphaeroforma arctica JP610]|uniref:Uncharacterized protein n=1 Tax=Sphaeroforma arctica JP610 TaxID=667725 RepID=A0A0L0G3V3_9EUKA|nr:hypothetical protein SARC_04818 [Sphaeroforma arctica JP610]KNC82898.1 hypothetical protein SARC_04818 [Sphaeroforma arctica JP610]|eukprot:XP_014156800.1 hypothetical protein SARC_04818 [Sphaeroforma arctica JP610]
MEGGGGCKIFKDTLNAPSLTAIDEFNDLSGALDLGQIHARSGPYPRRSQCVSSDAGRLYDRLGGYADQRSDRVANSQLKRERKQRAQKNWLHISERNTWQYSQEQYRKDKRDRQDRRDQEKIDKQRSYARSRSPLPLHSASLGAPKAITDQKHQYSASGVAPAPRNLRRSTLLTTAVTSKRILSMSTRIGRRQQQQLPLRRQSSPFDGVRWSRVLRTYGTIGTYGC